MTSEAWKLAMQAPSPRGCLMGVVTLRAMTGLCDSIGNTALCHTRKQAQKLSTWRKVTPLVGSIGFQILYSKDLHCVKSSREQVGDRVRVRRGE